MESLEAVNVILTFDFSAVSLQNKNHETRQIVSILAKMLHFCGKCFVCSGNAGAK